MMKKTFVACAVLILVLSLFAGCAFVKNLNPGAETPDPGQTDTTAPTSEITASESPETSPDTTVGMVTIETEKYEYSSEYIDVVIEVPQLDGLSDRAVQDSINKVFADISKAAKEEIKPAEEESKQFMEEGQMPSDASYMIYISYSVPYNHDGILSILFSDYRYFGGAHGGDLRSSLTFDLKTGKQLSLEDLMIKDSGYRELINSSIKKEIKNRVESGVLFELADFEDIGDDPAYYLTQDAVVFYFQEYEYFPYASGIQEFPMMYLDFSGMLKKEYEALNLTPVVLKTGMDNKLSVGEIAQIMLTGNPTTGYSWQYTIDDTSMLELSSDAYRSDATGDEDGAGGTYTWDFRALKAGTTTITFKYYRAWLDESDAAPEDKVEYTVIIK